MENGDLETSVNDDNELMPENEFVGGPNDLDIEHGSISSGGSSESLGSNSDSIDSQEEGSESSSDDIESATIANSGSEGGDVEYACIDADISGAEKVDQIGDLTFIYYKLASASGEPASACLSIPEPFKIVSGGMDSLWRPGGYQVKLMTSSYPKDDQTWCGSGTVHTGTSGASSILVYAIGVAYTPQQAPDGCFLNLPDNAYVRTQHMGAKTNYPNARATLTQGFELVGGGARVHSVSGRGNLLSELIPSSGDFYASAKDHSDRSTAHVTAYAIGLNQKWLADMGLSVVRNKSTSGAGEHRYQECQTLGDLLIGGGGRTVESSSGSHPHVRHLTGVGPTGNFDSWMGVSKGTWHAREGTQTTYCIGLSLD